MQTRDLPFLDIGKIFYFILDKKPERFVLQHSIRMVHEDLKRLSPRASVGRVLSRLRAQMFGVMTVTVLLRPATSMCHALLKYNGLHLL